MAHIRHCATNFGTARFFRKKNLNYFQGHRAASFTPTASFRWRSLIIITARTNYGARGYFLRLRILIWFNAKWKVVQSFEEFI